MQCDSRSPGCNRKYSCNLVTTNSRGTSRHRIMGDHSNNSSTRSLCSIFIVCVMFPALCASELVLLENGADFGAIWRINSFNLNPSGANVCAMTSLKLVTSLLSLDDVTSMCNSIYSQATCHALRSGIIGTGELYLPLVNYTCCQGFQRDGNVCPNVCPVDTYGQDCSLSCNCQNGGLCNPGNGTCQCGPGWRGPHCEFTCPPNRYGEGCEGVCDCLNGGSCHPETGSCLCRSGFTGSRCEDTCATLGSAALGCSYGYHCERCENFPAQQPCDPALGSCLCAGGWQGRFCAHTCQGLTKGSFCHDQCDCVHAVFCGPVDGRCECRPGWTGEKCDQECPPGSFGEQCRRSCSCPDGAVCDHEHGGCDCPAGWKGQICASPCMDDEWGAGCTQDCSCSDDQDCEPIRGRCFNPSDDSNTIIIVAASAGAVAAVIAVVVTIAVTLRCRKKRTSTQNPGSSLYNGVQNGSARSHQNERYSGPTPPARDPSTLPPSRNASERESQRYESIPGTRRPNSYLDIYEDSGQIGNPLYEPGSSGYEIPTPKGTLESGVDRRQNPGQSGSRLANPLYEGNIGSETPTPPDTLGRAVDGKSRSQLANPLYEGNIGYETPTPPGTLERSLDGQPRSQLANPLYEGNTGYQPLTPRGTSERAVDGSVDDGGYTSLAVPPRADDDYADPTM